MLPMEELAMPQPLIKGATVYFSGNAIEERPILAKHIGIIAGLWTDLDVRRATLLCDLLRTEARLATAMYMSIATDGGKQAVLNAVVEEKFPELFEEFYLLSKTIGKTANERNNVLHGIWGLSNQNSETLIWIDLKNHVKASATLREVGDSIMDSKDHKPLEKKLHDDISLELEAHREYTEKDFINIENRIKERIEELRQFGLKVFKRTRGIE